MAGAAMAEPGRGPPSAPAPGTEGLPRAFLQSLRTLFDILDDRRRGIVHLREIESRWQGADARELPRGVLEGLRQVAPASGYLTFERFVAGLRTSLLSADGGTRAPARAPARGGCPARPGGQPPPPQRLVFAPADEPRTVLERKPLPLGARPPPAGPGGAARSLEKLCSPAEAAPGPEEPERPQGAALERSPNTDADAVACRARELGVGDARWGPRARGERRRHTITNGVDCDLLKQMKELEQEQEVLLQGLEMMARGREWYQQQLQRVQERQRRLGQSRASAGFGAEGSPRLLGQLLPKVQEVARCLGELLAAACAGRALPSSSSGPLGPALAPASPAVPSWQQQTVLMLKEQNRLLTQVSCGRGAWPGAGGRAGPDCPPARPGGDRQERAYHTAGAGEVRPHQAAV
ncbi:suppressor APC domain-containing protein 2 isoform X1 [Orcinus orca]|uniref:Suppressor APC domain-containing protein 2 isoform X1 n=1 Tax=Tursiops truncatus TaxID=9739 RepID=A0A6J3RLT4_TURTR|nr:suppressor APC domain-containing protein 2 isoform X1 [Orcinus orca]XP_033715028.1 suppressor APC domain-containing protein 2 isoform X1 [Tursiops truncatus]XP_059869216.1 suppressor APC domain-containing protein 2 isoform X1 [Delphinus delphis]